MGKHIQLGWKEWISLPQLGVHAIKAKVDTGARTSALHALNIDPFERDHLDHVRFQISPMPRRPHVLIDCVAPLVGRKVITSSNGEKEERFIIETALSMGGHAWPIEMSLTNRESMITRVLLGRQAMTETTVIRPTEKYLQPKLSYRVYSKRPSSDAPK